MTGDVSVSLDDWFAAEHHIPASPPRDRDGDSGPVTTEREGIVSEAARAAALEVVVRLYAGPMEKKPETEDAIAAIIERHMGAGVRRPVAASESSAGWTVLCDDGSAWHMVNHLEWRPMAPIPGTPAAARTAEMEGSNG